MKTKIVRPIWNQNKHVSFWNTKSPIEGASTSILHMNPERSSLSRRVFSQRCSGGDTHQNWWVTAGVFQLQQAYQDTLLEWLLGMKGGRQGGRALWISALGLVHIGESRLEHWTGLVTASPGLAGLGPGGLATGGGIPREPQLKGWGSREQGCSQRRA